MQIQLDGNDQPYVEWEQANGRYKRAWIQRKSDPDKDWANAQRYLNVVRCNEPGHPGGNPTDFPIFNDLPDEQILEHLCMPHVRSLAASCRVIIAMPKGPKGEKRPADVIGAAITVAKIATGEIKETTAGDDSKDKAAQALGRKGGAARAAKLSKKRRSEIAKKAAVTRWKN